MVVMLGLDILVHLRAVDISVFVVGDGKMRMRIAIRRMARSLAAVRAAILRVEHRARKRTGAVVLAVFGHIVTEKERAREGGARTGALKSGVPGRESGARLQLITFLPARLRVAVTRGRLVAMAPVGLIPNQRLDEVPELSD